MGDFEELDVDFSVTTLPRFFTQNSGMSSSNGVSSSGGDGGDGDGSMEAPSFPPDISSFAYKHKVPKLKIRGPSPAGAIPGAVSTAGSATSLRDSGITGTGTTVTPGGGGRGPVQGSGRPAGAPLGIKPGNPAAMRSPLPAVRTPLPAVRTPLPSQRPPVSSPMRPARPLTGSGNMVNQGMRPLTGMGNQVGTRPLTGMGNQVGTRPLTGMGNQVNPGMRLTGMGNHVNQGMRPLTGMVSPGSSSLVRSGTNIAGSSIVRPQGIGGSVPGHHGTIRPQVFVRHVPAGTRLPMAAPRLPMVASRLPMAAPMKGPLKTLLNTQAELTEADEAAEKVEPRTSARRAAKPRNRNYVYEDESDEEEEGKAGASGGGDDSDTETPAKRSRRRQMVVSDDDSSDDEYNPATDKKHRKRARRTVIDDDDGPEYPGSSSSSVMDLPTISWSQGREPKNIIHETLQRCERIAAVLRNELALNVVTPGFSTRKIVTQAEVQAACQILGSSKEQSLSPYQLVGVNFLLLLYRKRLGGAILADEMGLGKTVQAIVFLALIKYLDGDAGPHLIVTPASVLENWQRELKKWCPGFTVIPFHGNERGSMKDELNDAARSGEAAPFHVFLTGYSLFERKSESSKADRSMLKKWNWSCVLMDEAHLLKDCTSYRNRNLRSVAQRAKHRLMITGTPLQNDLQELWSLLEFMMPNIFKNCDFDGLLQNKNGRKIVTAENMDIIDHIKGILGPFVMRRVKSEVMSQLSPKNQTVKMLDMVPDQRVAYAEAVDQYRALASNGAANLARRQISSIFTHLRKLANHPLLVRRRYSNQEAEKFAKDCFKHGIFGRECTLERIKEELANCSDYRLHKLAGSHPTLARHIKLTDEDCLQSAKCQLLAKLLPELRNAGHRPLIFSQWTAMLDILEWFLQSLNLKYNRLDGSTQVSDRQTLVDSYNGDSDVFAFLLSTRAGGQGLNLTGADTVIIHDVDFNPQMDKQAEDRCHRIGQSKPVTIYRLVTKETVDENIYAIAQRKLFLDNVLENSNGDVSRAQDEETKTMGQILSAILSAKRTVPGPVVLSERVVI